MSHLIRHDGNHKQLECAVRTALPDEVEDNAHALETAELILLLPEKESLCRAEMVIPTCTANQQMSQCTLRSPFVISYATSLIYDQHLLGGERRA